ncbi:MAG: hypothetical protein V1859_02685 [archaeon]
MDDKTIKEAISNLKKSDKRNFKQSIDLVFSLKDIDLKKPEHNVEIFLTLHQQAGKKLKICALVDADMIDSAKAVCDNVISVADFDKYKDKKLAKKLCEEYDFFVAQANIMPKIATVFGRTFGPRGKMPNPKAGCIVPPNINMNAVYDKLQKTLKVTNKKGPYIMTIVGTEETPAEVVLDNVKTIFNAVTNALPQGANNIKSLSIKYTMGKPVRLM